MSTKYDALGTFSPMPYGKVARVISGLVGGYGPGGGGGKAGSVVGGGCLFGSGMVKSVGLSGHLPENLFL